MTDLEFVNRLEGRQRDVVVRCYVQSFKYTHSKSSLASNRSVDV